MSLKTGTLTFTRLRVAAPLPVDFSTAFDDRVKAFAFRDFFPENEDKSQGWTALQDILDNDFKYGSHNLGDYRVFSLRIDRKKVPAALLRLRVLEAERRLREERGGKKNFTGRKRRPSKELFIRNCSSRHRRSLPSSIAAGTFPGE